ncbi:MAG: aerobic-type carbon monoxide dehydrogenase, large subunit CoxL/CutL-like protein [Holophagaceae bacterium]|nr:aerobic-type carbon monoxide dehydrogenase, large subunit CoxL/CutL-like protein [Holophagaceae bacterium]
MGETLTYVGKRLPFLKNREKVTGSVKYPSDIQVPGAHFGKLLTSPHAHALIKSIDVSEAEKVPGVVAIITFKDIPQKKINPAIVKWMHHHPEHDLEDMYVVSEKARFIGDIIGAVAAIDEETADRALGLIKVEYEVLPAALTTDEAMAPGAPLVHEEYGSNISLKAGFPGNRGDADSAFLNADVLVEAHVKTSRQHVWPLEPLTCTAEFTYSGELNVWTPAQRPMTSRKQIAELFELGEASVNVICEHAGGFFGEANWSIVPVCIALAKKAAKPVRLQYPPELYVLATPSREVYELSGKVGFSKEGRLMCGALDLLVESGGYFNRSSATTQPAMGAFQALYRLPVYRGLMQAVYTNTPTTGGARGYGEPQGVLLMEHLFDLAAAKLGKDRLELRYQNFKKMGEYAIQLPMETETQERVLRLAAEKFGWKEKEARPKSEGNTRRGIGVANYMDVSGGQPHELNDRHCVMSLEEDGTVTVTQSHPDGGMNLLGSCTQIAAEVLSIPFEHFHHVHGCTKGALNDMGLAANSGLYGMGNLYAKAAAALKEEILKVAARFLEEAKENLDIKDGVVFSSQDPEKKMTLREVGDRSIYNHSGGASHQISVTTGFNPKLNPAAVGTAMADITVDMETGEIKVEKLLNVHDIGRAINPMGVEGQLEGAMLLGYGYALFEDLAIDEKGLVRANNVNRYKMSSTLDLPDMEVVLFEDPAPSGPFGGKGVGMSGVLGVPSAIANALYDATGIWLEEMPYTPERVLAAIKAKKLES